MLEFASDGKEHSSKEAADYVVRRFGIPERDASARLSSGRTTYLKERVSWAISYLVAAGLLERTGRATFRITREGLSEAKLMPSDAGWRYLCKYESFRRFNPRCPQSTRSSGAEEASQEEQSAAPEEVIEQLIEMRNRELSDRLLQRVKELSPDAFERLIIKVISALGYGGGEDEMARQLGRPGDQGVDGEILEDPLGFDRVYLQAKRYGDEPVRASQVREFLGALSQKNAHKGVLITTSSFTEDARRAAEEDRQHKVVLLDGEDLVKIMTEHNIGVRAKSVYEIKDLDEDFFQDLE
ncbi:Mrr restriction system protein [Conexivisphaera calida]|uniref:Mrr restriction system protein n=1 Tax=Conexivisphaera calida TaxID=1874277 RepID=A0A4P2VNC0_9ARCH|nr:Mrr restriction system protein [Conexivisphaera calida]